MKKFKNKVVCITGASSGIGRDMTRYLIKLGYEVFAVGRDEVKLNKLKEELGTNVKYNQKKKQLILQTTKIKPNLLISNMKRLRASYYLYLQY